MGSSQPTGRARPGSPSRHRASRDIHLFLVAFRLAGQAQAVTHAPLPDVVDRLLAGKDLPRGADPETTWIAAARGSRLRASWRGGLDTCLVRALVAGTLLADRGGVVLHVGFCPDPCGTPRALGHAWLSVGDQTWGLPATLSGEAYSAALDLPMRRLEDKA
jgi:hypothetical protein